jgi:hypothetical protein
MVPPLQNYIWTDIVTGKRPVTSSKLAINLMVKNVQMSYEHDHSPANVQALTLRVHDFFTKNERIFDEEFKRILS